MTDAPSPGPGAVAVEHTTPWGAVVRGERWGAGPDRVLLLHEPGGDIDAWLDLPRALARLLPVAAVALDLPGHGLSDDPWEADRLPELLRSLAYEPAEGNRTCLVAAGDSAAAALELAADLALAGLICLSPSAMTSPVQRSPQTPKLLLAGTQMDDDVDRARAMAAHLGGWSMVTAIPVSARGTGILNTAWKVRITEAISGFLRDCFLAQRIGPAAMVHRPARPR